MNDIRYVCISDLHLGADTSLLTNLASASINIDPLKPSPVLEQLVLCLRALISQNQNKEVKPTLILNGDLLELALANTNKAVMAFERFIELTMPDDDPLFDRQIYFNPGNHDHHLWTLARETQYLDFIAKQTPGSYLEVPWHATKMLVEDNKTPLCSEFLTRIIKRYKEVNGFKNLEDATVTTVYPNFGLLRKNGSKYVVFHHGHFIEPIYELMSTVRSMIFPDREPPRQVWDIESENAAWIEFFWSTMGACDAIAADIELIYDKLQNPQQFDKLVANLSAGIVAAFHKHLHPDMWDRIESKGLHAAVKHFLGKSVELEVHDTRESLSGDAMQGLRSYLQGPLLRQILNERNDTMPSDITFVFGHTHKPFQRFLQNLRGYPEWIKVYNSGGWVVDTTQVDQLHGGAVILIDDELNAISLRMYNEAAQAKEYEVKVEEAKRDGILASNFYNQISGTLEASSKPWSEFSKTVSKMRKVYADNQAIRTSLS